MHFQSLTFTVPARLDEHRRLRAFVRGELAGELGTLIVRDLRVVTGDSGTLFVAFPSVKLTDFCRGCHGKNSLDARFCNWCGVALPDSRVPTDGRGRRLLHSDVLTPADQETRRAVSDFILDRYEDFVKGGCREWTRPDRGNIAP